MCTSVLDGSEWAHSIISLYLAEVSLTSTLSQISLTRIINQYTLDASLSILSRSIGLRQDVKDLSLIFVE